MRTFQGKTERALLPMPLFEALSQLAKQQNVSLAQCADVWRFGHCYSGIRGRKISLSVRRLPVGSILTFMNKWVTMLIR
ncbi:hypothetical protein P4S72_07820 [Vibrio sp. PP-XX7]